MKKVKVRIEGISPLLMHRFPVSEKDVKSKIRNTKQTEDDVESYLYKDEKGQLIQPAIHLIGALKKAGVKFQIPGQRKTTFKNTMGSGAVIIEPDMIVHKKQRWEVDRRPVVIQRSRIVRSRPMLKEGWVLEFEIQYDEDEIPQSVLNEVLVYAGKRVGIGDFRPSCGGSFGRFMVTQFEDVS